MASLYLVNHRKELEAMIMHFSSHKEAWKKHKAERIRQFIRLEDLK